MGPLALALLLLAVALPAHADRAWELGGIRLEDGQVERLAEDMARRTVEAVDAGVEGLELTAPQRESMQQVYREVSLDVYQKIVDFVAREDLDDAAKQEQVRALALEGQRRSHARLESGLHAAQMCLYTAWADAQVESFQSRRLDARRRRRRR